MAACAVSLIGLLALPAYQPGYNDQQYLPKDIPANAGYDAAARHFTQSLMASPDVLLVEADHDMRNPADFLILNKLAKGVLSVPGVSRVQSATRPEGFPSSTPRFRSSSVPRTRASCSFCRFRRPA